MIRKMLKGYLNARACASENNQQQLKTERGRQALMKFLKRHDCPIDATSD
ncbi:MAG: hypothetical protein K0S51_2661 [Bacillales bacterium]|nr:hypothetical protein [Bacillales bacterium]